MTPAPLCSAYPRGVASRQHAFTLTELLTVIAVVGILAAILIPVVGKVRDNARSAQCLSNMRQIGIAVMTFSAENKRMTPSAQAMGRLVNGQAASWFLQIAPYLGGDLTNAGVTRTALRTLMCPSSVRSQSGELDVPWDGFNDNGAAWPRISDYGINWAVNNPDYQRVGNNPGNVILTRIDSPKNPSDTPLLAEMVYQNNFIAQNFNVVRPASDQAAFDAGISQYQRFSQRHNGGSNILFFDGHIERFAYSELLPRATRGGRTPTQFVEGR